jgi:hypothetical protein
MAKQAPFRIDTAARHRAHIRRAHGASERVATSPLLSQAHDAKHPHAVQVMHEAQAESGPDEAWLHSKSWGE